MKPVKKKQCISYDANGKEIWRRNIHWIGGYNCCCEGYEAWLKEVANMYQLTVIIRDTIVNEYNGCVDIDSDVTKLAKAVYNILNSKNENSKGVSTDEDAH